MVHLILLPLLYSIPFISIIADTDNFGALVTKEASYYPPPEYPGLSLPLLTTIYVSSMVDRHDSNKPSPSDAEVQDVNVQIQVQAFSLQAKLN